MDCGLIHVFKGRSGCGLNMDVIFISLTFGSSFANLLLQAKENQINKQSKAKQMSLCGPFFRNQCDS